MDKTIKNKGIFFLFLKLILLLGVSYLLYTQLASVKLEDWKTLELKHPIFLILSCVLLVLNWGFEWLKWTNILKLINTNTSKKINFRAFMAGIATGLITPNMIGNFIGRMYYFKKELRPSIILMTLISSFSQFFSSIFFGLLSLFILNETPFGLTISIITIFTFLFCCLLLVFYFKFEKLKWSYLTRKKHFSKVVEFIKSDKSFRMRLLVLSLGRHFIFTLQFWLMFNAFEDALSVDAFLWIWQIFFWTTLVPSLWFGKLVIRESIALLVLGSIGFGQVEILTASVLIWIVNLALPSLVSLFICRQNKIEIE